MTDEQELAYLAHYGSMSEATVHGDIALISDSGEGRRHDKSVSEKSTRRLKLADYLREEEEKDGTN